MKKHYRFTILPDTEVSLHEIEAFTLRVWGLGYWDTAWKLYDFDGLEVLIFPCEK